MELREFTFMPINLYGLGSAKVKPLLHLPGSAWSGKKDRTIGASRTQSNKRMTGIAMQSILDICNGTAQ